MKELLKKVLKRFRSIFKVPSHERKQKSGSGAVRGDTVPRGSVTSVSLPVAFEEEEKKKKPKAIG